MNSLELETYEILRDKLGDQKASTILQFMNKKADQLTLDKKDKFLTKDDKVELIKWIVGLWIAQMVALIGLYLKGH